MCSILEFSDIFTLAPEKGQLLCQQNHPPITNMVDEGCGKCDGGVDDNTNG